MISQRLYFDCKGLGFVLNIILPWNFWCIYNFTLMGGGVGGGGVWGGVGGGGGWGGGGGGIEQIVDLYKSCR